MKISYRIAWLVFYLLWFYCSSGFATNLSSNVDYNNIHGFMTISNPLFTSVTSGNFSGNIANVSAGSSLSLIGNANITFTNQNFCPNCIIQEYVAWIPRGTVQTGSPNNIGLFSGQIHNNISLNPFSWTTNAPTQGGIYYIGAASTLQFRFFPTVTGTTGINHGTTNTTFASYQINVFGKNDINNSTLIISSDNDLGPAPSSTTANFLNFDQGILKTTTNFTLNAFRGVTVNSGGGTFDVDGNTTLSYAGNINGNGNLTKQGSGALLITGNNTYTGGTTVNTGILQGNSSSLQGNILNNAQLVFDQTGNGTFIGSISGSGNLIKQGAGTLIITGSNNYTGGTTVNTGILQGNSSSLQGNILNNAQLVFDQTGNGTYAGNISGSGSLVKIGNGNLTLAGNNTYQGTTHNQTGGLAFSSGNFGGTLINNGTILDLGPGLSLLGVVSGSGGYLGHITFAGSYSPGNSPALITAQNITFANSNTLTMELGGLTRGTQYDAIDASGNVTLGGVLDIKLINSFVPAIGNQFNLIAAQSINNQFSNVFCNNLPFNISCTVVNDGTKLNLQINEVLPPDSPLLPVSKVIPQAALNRLTPLLSQPGGTAVYQKALAEIAPQQQAAIETTSNITSQIQSANITQRLMANRTQTSGMGGFQNYQKLAMLFNGNTLPINILAMKFPYYNNVVNASENSYEGDSLQSQLGAFLNAQFNFTDRETSLLERGFYSNSYGFTGGVDYRMSQRLLLGLAVGYSNATTQFAAQGGNQALNNYSLTGFGSINLTDNWYVDLMVSGAYNQYHTNRNINYIDAVGSVNTVASSNADGLQSNFNINMGYDIPYQEWSFGIRGSTEYTHNNINASQEYGADLGLNINYNAQSMNSLTTDIGVVASKVTSTSLGVFSSQLILEWEHQYQNNSRIINADFVSSNNNGFTIQTDKPDRDYMNISASVSVQLPYGSSAFIQYDNRIAMRYISSQSVNLGVRFDF